MSNARHWTWHLLPWLYALGGVVAITGVVLGSGWLWLRLLLTLYALACFWLSWVWFVWLRGDRP